MAQRGGPGPRDRGRDSRFQIRVSMHPLGPIPGPPSPTHKPLTHCCPKSFLSACRHRISKQKIKKVYADKGYAGNPNRDFLALNQIDDGIMRKNSTTAKLTDSEILRNKAISKIRYIVEQYFGISHLHDRANRARFTTIIKNKFDAWFRQAAFNVARGMKILSRVTV